MPFEPQNPFERSLVRAASDPAHRPQFYRDLAAADLFIIQEGPPPARSGRTVLREWSSFRVRSFEWSGKPFIPAISSLARLEAAIDPAGSSVARNALEFMRITRGAELLLNPGSDDGKECPPFHERKGFGVF